LLTLSAALLVLVLVLAVLAYLVVVSPTDGSAQTVATSGLASWNPHVACSADSVAVQDVLGPAYPSQDLNGSRYQKNSTDGGVPSKRALSPPCSITNSAGQSVSTFVQIDGVYLSTYTVDSHDCSTQFKRVNGGGPYPNNETFCDNVGNILQVGTTSGQIHIEFDQDWLAADYCGSDVPSCDNVTIAQQQSNGGISLDVQGFVYWDGDHWELHPFTAWKQSSSPPPPPPPNAPPTVDFTWTPATGDNTTVFSFTATASDDHDLSSAIQVRWDWQGDGVWDTQWSTTKTASHQYHSAGNKTVIIEAMDSGGLASTKSHVVRVTAPSPPPPNAPPTVDFAWTPSSGDTSTIFSFNATAADDHDSPSSIQVRWDWTGDGTWDTAWSTTKTASQSYSSAGNKTVVVQAMDSGGLTSTRSHVVQVTASPPPPPPPNAPPTVDFTWTPTSGDTTTVFTFTAQASDDHDQPSAIQVRWDWNGDGTWDTALSATKTATHTFSSAASYTVVVQAADSGGLAAIQSHEVSVTTPPPPPPPPPGDFSIGASPTSLTILCGSSGSSTITLTSLNGLSGSASLSPSISSSGLVLVWPTGSVSPGSVTLAADGTATSTLTISTSLLTTPGTYTVTVTATMGSVTHSVSLTVIVKLL